MELDIIEESKNKIIFKTVGEDQTICNLLVDELNKNSSVKNAGCFVAHPLTESPQMIVEVKTGESVKKVINDTIKKIKNKDDKFLKSFKSIK